MLILLENPLLLSPAMYHVVIQQVATLLVKLPDAVWSILGEWIGRLAPPFAYRIVQVHCLTDPVRFERRLYSDLFEVREWMCAPWRSSRRL